jgi:hypothetical protein
MKRLSMIFIILFPLLLYSQRLDNSINVHFYPHSLSPLDNLLDGPNGKKLDISEDTFLIWIDLFPDMFFAHDTIYILISQKNIRTVWGNWWPVLNGKMILHNEHSKYALISPFELPLISADGFIDEKISIHIYPHELNYRDQLTDGPLEKLLKIEDNCVLIWVDLLPGAFFAHPTAYILISRENIRVEDGNWWPMLNGNTILYGQKNKTGILSPFKVSYTAGSLEKINKRKLK